QHPDDLAALNRVTQEEVAVYSGTFDHVEEVLRCLGIPATMNPDAKRLKARIVFANCSNSYDPGLIDQIGRHVEAGKWLVTSDWGLGHLVQRVFPTTVCWTGRRTGDEVVSVEPNRESLWSEVVVLGADPQWWLEGSSYPIEVVDPERVQVEAASHELLVKHRAPVVAVRFAWGGGWVYHVISHFWLRRTRTPQGRYHGPGRDFLR